MMVNGYDYANFKKKIECMKPVFHSCNPIPPNSVMQAATTNAPNDDDTSPNSGMQPVTANAANNNDDSTASTNNEATTINAIPSLLSVDNWKHTKAFVQNKRRETQTQHYIRMNAAPEVIELVSLDSKPFGTVGEQILAEVFKMAARTSSQNDGVFEGHKCEIKCARYWAGKDECRWQHLEPEHDYEFAMLALLDFHKWNVWCITKAQLMGELREKKVVTFQGKQGWWTLKSAIMPYLTPIHGLECLRKFANTIPK